ncbi:MAG TPA: 2-dehydropantoate 2-reductase [Anaerolineales bacterium]|jgi:2-dehydropantoate 2-reductase
MNAELLIVGTGALATLFAARLSGAGHRVTMLGKWPAGLEALRARGAHLLEADGSERAFPVRVAADARECRGAQHALVLVKAWQTPRAARQLADCLAPDGLAITLQNGLGNREALARDLGPGRVALGVTTAGATLVEPGLARAGGAGLTSIERNPALGPVPEALRSADFKLELVDDAQSLVWGKLIVNAAINPLTALLRVPNGVLLERPAARALMAALATEAAQVAAAEKVHLPFSDPVAAAEEVARLTAANHSSMLQDVQRGAQTEIDAICGAIVERGELHGISTPVNRVCRDLVRAVRENPPQSH